MPHASCIRLPALHLARDACYVVAKSWHSTVHTALYLSALDLSCTVRVVSSCIAGAADDKARSERQQARWHLARCLEQLNPGKQLCCMCTTRGHVVEHDCATPAGIARRITQRPFALLRLWIDVLCCSPFQLRAPVSLSVQTQHDILPRCAPQWRCSST